MSFTHSFESGQEPGFDGVDGNGCAYSRRICDEHPLKGVPEREMPNPNLYPLESQTLEKLQASHSSYFESPNVTFTQEGPFIHDMLNRHCVLIGSNKNSEHPHLEEGFEGKLPEEYSVTQPLDSWTITLRRAKSYDKNSEDRLSKKRLWIATEGLLVERHSIPPLIRQNGVVGQASKPGLELFEHSPKKWFSPMRTVFSKQARIVTSKTTAFRSPQRIERSQKEEPKTSDGLSKDAKDLNKEVEHL